MALNPCATVTDLAIFGTGFPGWIMMIWNLGYDGGYPPKPRDPSIDVIEEVSFLILALA